MIDLDTATVDELAEFLYTAGELSEEFYQEYLQLRDIEDAVDDLGARVYRAFEIRQRVQEKVDNLSTWL